MTVHALFILVDLPTAPLIKNVSAGSTNITITWERDLSSALPWYELQYNFTIGGCENYTGEGNVVINGSLESYTLENSSEAPVEEDGVYSIIIIAVNADGRSEASIPEISAMGDGMTLMITMPIYLTILYFISSPHWST